MNLKRINDMAKYTFIARGREGKRGHRVSVDARTRKEAEELALEKAPGETLELISRVASEKGALKPSNSVKSSNRRPKISKDDGAGKYEISFTVYNGKDVVDKRVTTVEAQSKDDAYRQLYSLNDEWRDSHSRTIFSHTGFNVIKK